MLPGSGVSRPLASGTREGLVAEGKQRRAFGAIRDVAQTLKRTPSPIGLKLYRVVLYGAAGPQSTLGGSTGRLAPKTIINLFAAVAPSVIENEDDLSFDRGGLHQLCMPAAFINHRTPLA